MLDFVVKNNKLTEEQGEKVCSALLPSDSDYFRGKDGKFRVIYLVQNLINRKIYIGQHTTKNLHDGYLGSGSQIQRALKKYGKDNFQFAILANCICQEQLDQDEKDWIAFFRIRRELYNIRTGGKGIWVYTPSIETGRKISQALLGKRKGIKQTEEHRRKNSEAHKGQIPWNKGLKLPPQTPESNLKRSQSQQGHIFSEEHNRKIGETRRKNGFRVSESVKQILREKNLGKKQTKETINKRTTVIQNLPNIVCIHCGHIGKYKKVMLKSHFDNCKHKQNLN